MRTELLAQAGAERRRAERMVDRLRELSPALRRMLVLNSRRAAEPAVALLLVDEARRHRHGSPEETRRWAELAAMAAERSDGPGSSDARAEAWAEVANAHRLVGEWDLAEAAFRRSAVEIERSSGDPMMLGEIASLRASLATSRERPKEAALYLAEALPAVHAAGELELAVRMLVQMTIVSDKAGDPRSGMEILQVAWAVAPPDLSGRLRVSLAHQTILITLAAGRPREALELWHDAEPIYRRHGSDAERARGRWLAARAMAELGCYDPAAELLRCSRETLSAEGRTAEVATVILDQAIVELHRDLRRACALAMDAIPLLAALDLPRSSLAALQAAVTAERSRALRSALLAAYETASRAVD